MRVDYSAHTQDFFHPFVQVPFAFYGDAAYDYVLFFWNVHDEVEGCFSDGRDVAESESPESFENFMEKRVSSDGMRRSQEETLALFLGFFKNVYGLHHRNAQGLL